MQNVVINMCEKFHDDQLRNDKALGNLKSDYNQNNKNNVLSAWRPVSESKNKKGSTLTGCQRAVLQLGTCEPAVCVRISRIESGVKVQIRIEFRIESFQLQQILIIKISIYK